MGKLLHRPSAIFTSAVEEFSIFPIQNVSSLSKETYPHELPNSFPTNSVYNCRGHKIKKQNKGCGEADNFPNPGIETPLYLWSSFTISSIRLCFLRILLCNQLDRSLSRMVHFRKSSSTESFSGEFSHLE